MHCAIHMLRESNMVLTNISKSQKLKQSVVEWGTAKEVSVKETNGNLPLFLTCLNSSLLGLS